jgi:phosphoribosylamine--glycine ligase
MNILVIGSGGREHALCSTLKKSARPSLKIFCAPGNAGIASVAECVPINPTNIAALADFAQQQKIDLTIVGSEAPLAAGIVDLFEERQLKIAGATRKAAQLESSKAFAKDFMSRHSIPTARYRVADSPARAREILQSGEFGAKDSPVVVKADGLAAGKGVVVAASHAEAESAIADMMLSGSVGPDAAHRVIIEEALRGREASLLLFADAQSFLLMPPARDHKRVGEGDTGPNTGGMGAITAAGVLDESMVARVVREVVEPTLDGALSEGFAFRGILFVGLMLTDDGPRVLEYNVRFGDPEAQAILVRLQSDLVDVFEAIAHRRLHEAEIEWTHEASACVVLAARGYPGQPETGARITGLERASEHKAVQIFHAGTARSETGDWVTAGGRVVGVTATAATLDRALARCYDAVNEIHWNGMHYRRDIGRFTKD